MKDIKVVKNEEWKEVEVNGISKQMPVNFVVDKMSNFSNIILGQSPDGEHVSETVGDMEFHQGNSFFDKNKLSLSTKKILKKNAKKVAPKDSILMSVRAPVGDVNVTNREVVIGRGLAAIVTPLNKKFIFNLIKINKQEFSKLSNGSIFEAITGSVLKEFQCILPPLSQQNSIASVLSKQESIIEDMEALIYKYESRLKYLSEELLCGRLRLKEVDGQNTLYKNADDNWKEVELNGSNVSIPADWDVTKISDTIIENNKSKLKAGDLSKTGEYPAFNCSKQQKYFAKSYNVENENIFLSTGGTASVHYYDGKAAYSTDVFSIQTKEDALISKYLFIFLASNINDIDAMFYGAGLKHLNKTEFRKYQIFSPKITEQLAITKVVEMQEAILTSQKEILAKERQKFDFLLENLLSGTYLLEAQDE